MDEDDLSLVYKTEDLKESSEEIKDDFEFEPPTENKAKKLDVGNIFTILFVALFVIIGVIFLVSKVSQIKKEEIYELDKAGSKYIPEIKITQNENPYIPEEEPIVTKNNKEVDEIIKDLPSDFQQPQQYSAPVSVGSSNTSTRPDTRNSISIRKIEGILGQESKEYSKADKTKVMDVMSGNISRTYGSSYGQSKEEYVANILKQGNSVSQSLGGYGQNQGAIIQSNKEKFYNNSSNNAGNGQFLSYSSLWDGTVITGALETGINTDNPGRIIARVTENVYSSYDSSLLLIPSGTLLFATYNSSVSYGQNRVQIAWNLLIRPDGYRLELGNMNGVDSKGQSGIKGFATNHPFETLKALGLVAMFSVIHTETNNSINSQSNEYVKNALTDVYSEASRLGNKIVERALDIKPTISIEQGTPIKIITNMPLDLPPVKVNQVTRKYTRTN